MPNHTIWQDRKQDVTSKKCRSSIDVCTTCNSLLLLAARTIAEKTDAVVNDLEPVFTFHALFQIIEQVFNLEKRTAFQADQVVVMVTGCGSGGGAPVGRRWRRVRWTGEPGGLGGIVVRSAFSLNAHPAPRDQRPRTPPPAHEIQRRSRIFGNKLDQVVNEGLFHEFAGAQGAPGEVERSRRDSGA